MLPAKMPETSEKSSEDDRKRKKKILPAEEIQSILDRFKAQLGDRVSDVKTTDRLVSSPARLVDPQGTMNPELQRVYRLLNKEYEVPLRK